MPYFYCPVLPRVPAQIALWKVRWMTYSCCSRDRRLKFTA